MGIASRLADEFRYRYGEIYSVRQLLDYYEELLAAYPDSRIAMEVYSILTGYTVSGAMRLISPAIFESRLAVHKLSARVELTIRYAYENQTGRAGHINRVTFRDIEHNPTLSHVIKDLAWKVMRETNITLDEPILSYQAANSAVKKIFGETVSLPLIAKELYHGEKHKKKPEHIKA